MPGKESIALYIHIPFCTRKCRYCSFYTIADSYANKSSYCEAIIHEWKRKWDLLQNRYFVDTIFFGGGTPSLISPKLIQQIIQVVGGNPTEITLEANPEHLSNNYLKELSHTQVNRISIGAQTFSDADLHMLGRSHSSSHIFDAICNCIQNGFFNISIDLIYGLPNQTLSCFLTNIQQAASLPITHISLYNLTIDPHTSFYKHRKQILPSIMEDDILAQMSLEAESILTAKGFERYELASYAKPLLQSKHNLYYWTDRPFLGLGASASQYIDRIRSKNISHIFHYLQAVKKKRPLAQESEKLSDKEHMKEALALRLRLTKGFLKDDFPKNLVQAFIHTPKITQFIEETSTHYLLNRRGRLFHDLIAEEIMSLSYE